MKRVRKKKIRIIILKKGGKLELDGLKGLQGKSAAAVRLGKVAGPSDGLTGNRLKKGKAGEETFPCCQEMLMRSHPSFTSLGSAITTRLSPFQPASRGSRAHAGCGFAAFSHPSPSELVGQPQAVQCPQHISQQCAVTCVGHTHLVLITGAFLSLPERLEEMQPAPGVS